MHKKITYIEAQALLSKTPKGYTAPEWEEVSAMALISSTFNLNGIHYQIEYICPKCRIHLDNMDFTSQTSGECLNCGQALQKLSA